MANHQKRNVTRYTPLGKLLDRLCIEKEWSFHKLALESKTHKSSVIRASEGKYTPDRITVVKWADAFQCDQEMKHKLLHIAGYATDEEIEEARKW